MTREERLMTPASAYRNVVDLSRELQRPIVPTNEPMIEATQTALRRLSKEQGRNLVEVIKAKVEESQKTLLGTESLRVFCDAGREQIVVDTFEFPSWNVAVVEGIDENGNKAQRIINVQDLKVTCKVLPLDKAPRKAKIGFTLPSE